MKPPRSRLRTALKTGWRTLPQPVRRAVLAGLGTFAARPTPHAPPAGPLIFAGFLTHASGIGAAARSCHDALQAAGLDVRGIDLTARLAPGGVPVQFDFRDGGDVRGGATLFLHMPPPLVPLAMARLGRAFVRDKRIVGHWFWELPQTPPAWRRALPFVHEIWVNSRFVGEAMRAFAPATPVRVVAYPMAMPEPRLRTRRPGDPFTVLTVFNTRSNFERKNPQAAIRAFKAAFGDDPQARLVVKHAESASWPPALERLAEARGGAANIELVGEAYSSSRMGDLFARADAVLSLHRSEGLGLVIVEAMLRGVPVVGTDWSAPAEYLSAEVGRPIGCRLVAVDDPQGTYSGLGALWAEPDVEAAAAALRRLRDDPEDAARLARNARAAAADRFAPARYAADVKAYLAGR